MSNEDEERCTWTTVRGCSLTKDRHYLDSAWAHSYKPPEQQPEPHEVVPAMAVTTWACAHCGHEQDVWGEGAINGWMDCQCVDCDCGPSWLSMDLGLDEALGLSA